MQLVETEHIWTRLNPCVCVCVLQMHVARLEQLEKELQEARGNQESQLQVRHTVHNNTRRCTRADLLRI